MPIASLDAKAAYLDIASIINARWVVLGPLPPLDGPAEVRKQYQATWYGLEDDLAMRLAAIEWPEPAQMAVADLTADVAKVRTMLQPSAAGDQYLELIAFSAREQTAAAAALRARLGLAPPRAGDLI
jgi:hypothetical protein